MNPVDLWQRPLSKSVFNLLFLAAENLERAFPLSYSSGMKGDLGIDTTSSEGPGREAHCASLCALLLLCAHVAGSVIQHWPQSKETSLLSEEGSFLLQGC